MKKIFVALLAALCLTTSCKKDEDASIDPPVNPPATTVDGITDYGAVDALFSVAPDKQVRFSMGNLQYRASSHTWRFAEHQYDRIGTDNENISDIYGGWIDLFGWATSGWDCGNTYYMPYNWEFEDDYERGEGYGPLPPRDYDLVGDYANCDWGVFNAISNGGNKPGMWRTLSVDEWQYLIEKRPNASQKYAVASIEGINGLILLPDDWVLPEGSSLNIGLADNGDMSYYARTNNLSAEQWLPLQCNGAVFLPAAGSRMEYKEVDYVNDIGRYWTPNRCFDKPLYEEWCAYTFYFQSDDIIVREFNNPRNYGRAVRLVRDAQ